MRYGEPWCYEAPFNDELAEQTSNAWHDETVRVTGIGGARLLEWYGLVRSDSHPTTDQKRRHDFTFSVAYVLAHKVKVASISHHEAAAREIAVTILRPAFEAAQLTKEQDK